MEAATKQVIWCGCLFLVLYQKTSGFGGMNKESKNLTLKALSQFFKQSM